MSKMHSGASTFICICELAFVTDPVAEESTLSGNIEQMIYSKATPPLRPAKTPISSINSNLYF